MSKTVSGALAADRVEDFFSPNSEAQAPQINFDEFNKLVEELDKEKKVSSGLSRLDSLTGKLDRDK